MVIQFSGLFSQYIRSNYTTGYRCAAVKFCKQRFSLTKNEDRAIKIYETNILQKKYNVAKRLNISDNECLARATFRIGVH